MAKFATTIEFNQEVSHWLDWQCRMISNVKCGGVFLTTNTKQLRLQNVALWPDSNPLNPSLDSIAANAIRGNAGIIKNEMSEATQPFDYVSHCLIQKGQSVGVVVLALAIRTEQQCQAVLQLLQWGSAFMEKILERGKADNQESSMLALNSVAVLANNEPIAVAGYHLCNYLAEQFDCDHVEIGLCKGLQVHMLSMSHQLNFDRRIEHIRQIEFAMEECLAQNKTIILPTPSGEPCATIHKQTTRLITEHSKSVCLIPLTDGETQLGVITLTSNELNYFDTTTINLLTSITNNLAPIMRLNIANNRPLWKKVGDTLMEKVKRLIGPGYFRVKLTTACSLIIICLLSIVQTDRVITASASVEGKVQQAIVAPFSSYLKTAQARAGDKVLKNQIIATLDDRELRLEHEKWLSERDKQGKEYHQALAKGDRAQISMLTAQIAQTNAQLSSIEEKLQHTQLRAPFDGLLVSGDWHQSLGMPIERGQLMFEVIPAENYRVALKVDEHDVVSLNTGQNANLRLTGLSDQSIALSIAQIFPIASVEQGKNNFRVESEIIQAPSGLRPGMQGVAKVVVGRGSLILVWSHNLLSRLRLWAWSLGL